MKLNKCLLLSLVLLSIGGCDSVSLGVGTGFGPVGVGISGTKHLNKKQKPHAVCPSPAEGIHDLPHQYCTVPQFTQCLSSQKIDGSRIWCVPASKPESCPDASWKALKDMQGVPDCVASGSPGRMTTSK